MVERTRSLGHALTGFLVQPMESGVEMIAGVVRDPHFGPLVACGAGGVLVELLKDVSVRLSPVSEQDAAEMVRALRTYPLLTGYRGGPKYDVPALEETLLRISSMAEGLRQIAEMDCNPLMVCEQGVAVVDVRIRVEPPTPPLPLGAPS
jgi:acyl-CoA synthetase (NDP forming)